MRILLVSLVTIVMCSGSYAADLRELEEKIEALTNEIANMKEKMALPAAAEKSFGGMGLGASKVYFSQSPLSIGGYGELIVQNTQGEGVDKTDALRLIPYIGYRFNDWIIFNSEIEFEHSGIFGKSRTATDSGGDTVKVTEPAGEVVVEFAYLDFLVAKNLNVRVGHVLLPFGITNLQHDLALSLAARTGTVRIEAPIPGKSLVGIEVPNKTLEIVGLKIESTDLCEVTFSA